MRFGSDRGRADGSGKRGCTTLGWAICRVYFRAFYRFRWAGEGTGIVLIRGIKCRKLLISSELMRLFRGRQVLMS